MTPAIGHFHIERSFALPRDRLWHLLTDPAMRSQWGAPSDEDVLIVDASDLREGGRDLHRCGPRDDPAYTVETIWFRLAEPDLACFSETVDAGGARIATSLVTYGLTDTATGCEFSIDVQLSSFVGPGAMSDFQAGWTSGLNRLAALVEQQA